MSMPAAEPPSDAEALARQGAITHLTVNGERIALIVPTSLLESMQILADLLANDRVSAELAPLLPDVYPWARHLPTEALREFAADLRNALRSGADAPELMQQVVISWRVTAEAYADPELLAELRAPVSDCGPVPEPAAT